MLDRMFPQLLCSGSVLWVQRTAPADGLLDSRCSFGQELTETLHLRRRAQNDHGEKIPSALSQDTSPHSARIESVEHLTEGLG